MEPKTVIFPPRPEGKIPPSLLPMYEQRRRWVVQRKFNGQRNLIHISTEREVRFYGREGTAHLNFVAPSNLVDEVLSLNLQPGQEYWLDGELMDAKTANPAYKNKVILYDVLQAGRYLLGVKMQARLDLLNDICRKPQELEPAFGIALRSTPNIWMAQTWADNFVARFEDLILKDEIEGLVLKQINSALDNMGGRYYEVPWLIRCRKSHKNYQF